MSVMVMMIFSGASFGKISVDTVSVTDTATTGDVTGNISIGSIGVGGHLTNGNIDGNVAVKNMEVAYWNAGNIKGNMNIEQGKFGQVKLGAFEGNATFGTVKANSDWDTSSTSFTMKSVTGNITGKAFTGFAICDTGPIVSP